MIVTILKWIQKINRTIHTALFEEIDQIRPLRVARFARGRNLVVSQNVIPSLKIDRSVSQEKFPEDEII
jgi:hypothetical protein